MTKAKIKYFHPILITLLLANGIVYVSIWASTGGEIVAKKDFVSAIDGWRSEEVVYDKTIIEQLSPDRVIYRTFRKEGSLPITVFISFYNALHKADLSHSPTVCFTGQGWKILSTGDAKINLDNRKNEVIQVNKLEQVKNDYGLLAYYWYQNIDDTYKMRAFQKISLLINKLAGRSENNAFVRLTIHVPENMPIAKVEGQLSDFVRMIYPELLKYMV